MNHIECRVEPVKRIFFFATLFYLKVPGFDFYRNNSNFDIKKNIFQSDFEQRVDSADNFL